MEGSSSIQQKRATIIIITRNRSVQVTRCLQHLQSQTVSDFETIVVDNSTSSETKELLNGSKAIQYLHILAPLGSQPILRNEGFARAAGEIVAFLDDDGYAAPDWLEELLSCYQIPTVGAAGGRIIEGRTLESSANTGRLHLFGGVEGNWNVAGDSPFEVDHLQGTNMSFRRSALEEVGGWDQTLSGGYATFEELDVCMRVRNLGLKIMFNPRAEVVHGAENREAGFGRSAAASPRLAYYLGRNGSYVYLKNLRGMRRYMAALFINPAIECIRCLLGSFRHPSLSAFRPIGVWSCITHLAGVARGCLLFAEHRTTPVQVRRNA